MWIRVWCRSGLWLGDRFGGLEPASNEISRHLSAFDRDCAILGFVAISAAAFVLLRTRLDWKDLAYPPLLLLPAMVLLAIDWISTVSHPLAGWGALVWPVAFLIQYWLLWRCETEWLTAASWYHCGTLWLGVFLVWRENSVGQRGKSPLTIPGGRSSWWPSFRLVFSGHSRPYGLFFPGRSEAFGRSISVSGRSPW